MKKCKLLTAFEPLIIEKYGNDIASKVLDVAYTNWTRLCTENDSETKAVKKHTVAKIYPTIGLYLALIDTGIAKVDAEHFLDLGHSKLAESEASSIRNMLKIPGLYRLMPKIFRKVTRKSFGSKQGFAATFYTTDKTRCKFDMTRCLYYDVCTANGCPELTKCFCHTDDVKDGNMHPRLCWNRTKTIGEGGDVCDFDLFIIPNDKKK